MILQYPELVAARKLVPIRPKWRERDSNRVEFAAALSIDGVVVEGFELRGKALIEIPERGVCFNLQHHPSQAPCVQLTRIEWNPVRQHTNPLKGPDHLCGLRLAGSHIHRFEDNWIPEFGRMRSKNLPFASPIEPNPASYDELLELVEKTLRIEGIRGMEPPPWREGSLFGG